MKKTTVDVTYAEIFEAINKSEAQLMAIAECYSEGTADEGNLIVGVRASLRFWFPSTVRGMRGAEPVESMAYSVVIPGNITSEDFADIFVNVIDVPEISNCYEIFELTDSEMKKRKESVWREFVAPYAEKTVEKLKKAAQAHGADLEGFTYYTV